MTGVKRDDHTFRARGTMTELEGIGTVWTVEAEGVLEEDDTIVGRLFEITADSRVPMCLFRWHDRD